MQFDSGFGGFGPDGVLLVWNFMRIEQDYFIVRRDPVGSFLIKDFHYIFSPSGVDINKGINHGTVHRQ